jgi:hypothetical protein
LASAGFLTVEDLQSAHTLELAIIPRIGAKSLAILYELKGVKVPDEKVLCGKAKCVRINWAQAPPGRQPGAASSDSLSLTPEQAVP